MQGKPDGHLTPEEIKLTLNSQVDIRTGESSLMDYLLKPLKKTLSDSFGER